MCTKTDAKKSKCEMKSDDNILGSKKYFSEFEFNAVKRSCKEKLKSNKHLIAIPRTVFSIYHPISQVGVSYHFIVYII